MRGRETYGEAEGKVIDMERYREIIVKKEEGWKWEEYEKWKEKEKLKTQREKWRHENRTLSSLKPNLEKRIQSEEPLHHCRIYKRKNTSKFVRNNAGPGKTEHEGERNERQEHVYRATAGDNDRSARTRNKKAQATEEQWVN